MNTKVITIEEYHSHAEACDGYCSHCREFTRFGNTEPDAIGYSCPICHRRESCLGVESALLEGFLDVPDEPES